MVKLYTNTKYLTEQHRQRVFPLLFDMWYANNGSLSEDYSLVDKVEDCDYCVLPLDYIYLKNDDAFFVNSFISNAKLYQKKVWLYTAGDFGYTLNDSLIFNFRFGGFDSKLPDNTVIMPSFINDPYATVINQGFSVLGKTIQPSVGFVGNANGGFVKYIKEVVIFLKHFVRETRQIDSQNFFPSSIVRNRYLNILESDFTINSQFIKRRQYRAGAENNNIKEETTKAFYNNMFENLYTFCIRGAGNFSVRFYETLAVGRIPVLVNTDCRLPLDSIISWDKHCVIVDTKENIIEAIELFHAKYNDIELKLIQQSNRNLWLNSLERVSFFKTLAKEFS